MHDKRKPDATNIGSAFVASALGVVVLIGAREYSDLGALLPKIIGIGLIFLSVLLIALELLRPGQQRDFDVQGGSLARRAGLVALMIVWVALLPVLGFLPISILAFMLIAFAVPAEHRWTPKRLFAHGLGAVVLIVVFWAVLLYVLYVPLPAGQFF